MSLHANILWMVVGESMEKVVSLSFAVEFTTLNAQLNKFGERLQMKLACFMV